MHCTNSIVLYNTQGEAACTMSGRLCTDSNGKTETDAYIHSRVGNSHRSVGQDRLKRLRTDYRDLPIGLVDQLGFQSNTMHANIVPKLKTTVSNCLIVIGKNSGTVENAPL